MASDIVHFVWINTIDDQFGHSRCSNCSNRYPCCQKVVLYAQSVNQKSLYQISKYCLWWRPTSDTCRCWQYITYLEGIQSPIPSCNACNTSYLMGIVRLKRACHKILSIGEHTYTTLPKTAQWADFKHYHGHYHVCVLTITWNSEVKSFGPYYTHQMWCVTCISW